VAAEKGNRRGAIQAWLGAGSDITFEPDDFEILDLTVGLMPELRICAQAVKMARAAGIRYPIDGPDEIVDVVDEHTGFVGGGYEFSRERARVFLSPDLFPIEHEGELISRVFLALMRARREGALAADLFESARAAERGAAPRREGQ
jgi:hypothetical protein